MSVQGNRLILGGAGFDRNRLEKQEEGIAIEKGFSATVKEKLGLAQKISIDGQFHTVNKESARKWFLRTTQRSPSTDKGSLSAPKALDKAIETVKNQNIGLGLGTILNNHVIAQQSAIPPSSKFDTVASVINLFINETNLAKVARDAVFQRAEPVAEPMQPMLYYNEAEAIPFLQGEAARRFHELRAANARAFAMLEQSQEPLVASPFAIPATPAYAAPACATPAAKATPAPVAAAWAAIETAGNEAETLSAEQEARNRRNEAVSQAAQAEVAQRLESQAKAYFAKALLVERAHPPLVNMFATPEQANMNLVIQPASQTALPIEATLTGKDRKAASFAEACLKTHKFVIAKPKLPLFEATRLKQRKLQSRLNVRERGQDANLATFNGGEIRAEDYLVRDEENEITAEDYLIRDEEVAAAPTFRQRALKVITLGFWS